MKRTGHLYEKLVDRENVRQALHAAAKRKKHRRAVQRALADEEATVDAVIGSIEGGYEPKQPNMRTIYDASRGKTREIACPKFSDQIVHHAVMQVLEPILMRGMTHSCMASVPGRGQHKAVHRVERWVRCDRRGTKYAAVLDIRHFYRHIDRERLKSRLGRLIKDERFLGVVFAIIDSYDGPGLPIGYYTSQWFANLYLQDIDHMAEESARHYVRYMDDVVILGPNKRRLRRLLRDVMAALEALGLRAKGNWQVFRVSCRPVAFLGTKITRARTALRSRTFLRMTRRIRRIGRKPRPTVRDARAVMSFLGTICHIDGEVMRQRHVYPYVSISKLKGLIRDASREQRQAA